MIRVLVIDDSFSFLTAATEVVLVAEGFELAGVAQSGEEGIEFARIARPDFALIDFNMPGLNGEETAEQLAAESPETATVVMTATTDGRTDGMFDKRELSPAKLAELWQEAQMPRIPT